MPTATNGDCFDRTWVRAQEMRQSLRIIRQCLDNMPEGPFKADHPLTTPPPRERTLTDIETLIHHFTSTAWGRVVPRGEATGQIESARGLTQYAIIFGRRRAFLPHPHPRAVVRQPPGGRRGGAGH